MLGADPMQIAQSNAGRRGTHSRSLKRGASPLIAERPSRYADNGFHVQNMSATG